MRRFSHIISLCLATLVVLTAQSAALARTMPDATGQMVICTGTGPMMVYVDANGEPTGAPQICPEYALGLIVALESAVLELDAHGVWHRLGALYVGLELSVLRLGTPNARGPPVLV